MNNEPPEHLKDKYRLYAIWAKADYGSRPVSDMMIVHVGRPVAFETFCNTFIFDHIELTIQKTGEKIKTEYINGIQKIDNKNDPHYELTADGVLKEIFK